MTTTSSRPVDTPTIPRARTGDPHTSHAAAASVRDISKTHARILALFHTHGTLSDPELWDHWQAMADDYPPISPSGLRSRRAELVTLGRLKDTRWRVTLDTGRQATVWGLAQ